MILIITFKSDDACDHIPRSLDFIRRMGFTLNSLHVDNHTSEPASVEIALSTDGQMSARTYFARVRQMPGVSEASACDSSGSVLWPEFFAEHTVSENARAGNALDGNAFADNAKSRLESISH